MAWTNLLLVTSFLLVCEGSIRRRRTIEIINDAKPIMHTYVDKSIQYVDDELISLWNDAWTNAGWDIKILSWGDSIKHPEYTKYKIALDDAGICCLPRQTYLRHLAMSTIPEGGFYSEVYVFPLHKVVSSISDGFELTNGFLPYDGSMTIYDGVIASVFSGNKSELDRITSTLFSNLEKNAALSLQKIQSENPTLFNFRGDNMYDNIIKSSDDVCEKSQSKFIIRFHTNELNHYGFQEQSRAYIVKRWYVLKCVFLHVFALIF